VPEPTSAESTTALTAPTQLAAQVRAERLAFDARIDEANSEIDRLAARCAELEEARDAAESDLARALRRTERAWTNLNERALVDRDRVTRRAERLAERVEDLKAQVKTLTRTNRELNARIANGKRSRHPIRRLARRIKRLVAS
jgi:outer membrane murein-binding lipoprotein Lpp